jgi:proteasome accessory factor C
MERDEVGPRRVDPYHLLFQGGQFYVLGYAHERKAIRVFRLSRIRGKVSYATKAEHDFRRPEDFDPRVYANRADWQLGDQLGVAEIFVSDRIAWQIERHFGRYGEVRAVEQAADQDGEELATKRNGAGAAAGGGERVFQTGYSSPRGIVSWVLGLGAHARLLAPPELIAELEQRVELLEQRHGETPPASAEGDNGGRSTRASVRSRGGRRGAASEVEEDAGTGRGEVAIRPERFARLVTLASILIEAGRAGKRVAIAEVRERLQLSDEELREDVNVLNVVNFGGGSYVLYAEITDTGEIEVDPEPYSDNFDRPARLLPVEAKALVAAIDLIGEHIPEGALTSAREKIVAALGEDPMEQGLQVARAGGDDAGVARLVSDAIVKRRLIELEYYKENEDELSLRTVEPYALTNGREGWYVAAFDPERDGVRHFRLDRIKRAKVSRQKFKPRPEVDPAAQVDGWLRTGEVEASRSARVWVSPERARWAREARRVVRECSDGAVVVELSFAGIDWLVREILKEAGDAAVLEPKDAREAVRAAVARLRAAYAPAAGSRTRSRRTKRLVTTR